MSSRIDKKLIRDWEISSIFKRRRWAFLLGGLVGAPALGLGLAMTVVYSTDREYLGAIHLQMISESTPSRQFVETQFHIIKSKETLSSVIDELQLIKRWNSEWPSAANARLVEMIEAEIVEGTDLLAIKVYDTDPRWAAKIANAIARTYQKQCDQIAIDQSNYALDLLNAQEILQEQKVEDARQRMLESMEKLDGVNVDGSIPAWAEQEVASIRSQIDTLDGLSGERMIEEAVALNVMDSTASTLFPERSKLKVGADVLLQSGLGKRHPDVMAIRARNEEINRLLEEGVRFVKDSLEARLEIARQTVADLEGVEGESGRNDPMSDRKAYAQYVEAKCGYETQNLILMDMREQLAKERIDLAQPRETVVLHEMAPPSETPARPSVPLYVAVGLIGGGLLFFVPVGTVSMYLAYAVLRS